jgi:hypothetical protein
MLAIDIILFQHLLTNQVLLTTMLFIPEKSLNIMMLFQLISKYFLKHLFKLNNASLNY